MAGGHRATHCEVSRARNSPGLHPEHCWLAGPEHWEQEWWQGRHSARGEEKVAGGQEDTHRP